ncbi:tetratricopeptide repeat protein [Brachyspira sp. SAP_772]|uniref:tetratricopeptide repeat protein n=1 Tax=Brachyspira sp. SAP_772 TaxID=2608385 RepID=UPI0012F4CA9D|nr:tetratricopeptide repeat protein [Brachyspira sp. SAP_772]
MTEELKYKIKELVYFKKVEEAIKLINEAIEKDNNDSELYLSRGALYLIINIHTKAIEDFNKAIELNPKNEKAYFSIGFLKAKLEKYEESIEYFNKAIELNPKNENAYFGIGVSKAKLGMYEESIEYFNKAIELNSKNENIYFDRGIIKLQLGKYEESIEDFNKVIELNPNSKDAYFNMGLAKSRLEKYEESIEDFNKVIELNPKNENAYFIRGALNYELEKYEESIEDFNKVIELNPNNKEAYFNRGVLKINLKKYKQAVNDFKIFAKNNNDAFDITIIKILQDFNKYNDINKFFKLLVIDENKELWKNEPITNLIFHFEYTEKLDNEIIENIKYLILYEYFLLKILTFNTNDKNIEISHYTSLNILLILLEDENSEEAGNIRINNITTANDPKEGDILESIFNRNNIDIKIGSDEKAVTLQTSYSRNRDSLTMFRLYGKKNNKEATGICLVLDNKYFTNLYTSPFSYYDFDVNNLNNSEDKNNKNSIKNNEDNEKIKKEENKRNLYWVLYYNEKLNKLIFNKEDLKYTSNVIDLNGINDYKEKLKEDDTIEDKIKYAFSKIFEYTIKIKEKNINPKLYNYLFENIKYIIKHEAFFEEQELRMLVTSDYKSKEIQADRINNKLYIDYLKLFDKNTNYIKEIIIGSKVENNESLAEYIRKILHEKNTDRNKLDNIKVLISEAPLR